jgi:DNA-binding HxlR family transcriptional regulator
MLTKEYTEKEKDSERTFLTLENEYYKPLILRSYLKEILRINVGRSHAIQNLLVHINDNETAIKNRYTSKDKYKHLQGSKWCFSSQKHLCDTWNISPRTLTRIVKRLALGGVIEVQKVHKLNYYKVVDYGTRLLMLNSKYYDTLLDAKTKLSESENTTMLKKEYLGILSIISDYQDANDCERLDATIQTLEAVNLFTNQYSHMMCGNKNTHLQRKDYLSDLIREYLQI